MAARLYFTQIEERRSKIPPAHERTFSWIFSDHDHGLSNHVPFRAWLEGASAVKTVYWVSGKPGSGKSTLMQYLFENETTRTLLKSWAGSKQLLIGHCFFWNAGTDIQKSLTGLYRSVLHQLITQQSSIATEAFPERWEGFCLGAEPPKDLSDAELRSAFDNLVRRTQDTTRIALFVDGLDEFDGSDEQRQAMIDSLVQLANAHEVKICASSRPWNIFVDAFATSPKLRLELLTRGDITNYVQDHFRQNQHFKQLKDVYPERSDELMDEIVNKASGVFLWVYLVVKNLLTGLRDGDTVEVLFTRLRQIPDDLDKYFMSMMQSIAPCHRAKASTIFQLMLNPSHRPNLLTLSFIDEQELDFATSSHTKHATLPQIRYRHALVPRKVNSLCMGLLECGDPTNNPANMLCDRNVDYLHRTVHEFLTSMEAQQVLLQFTNGSSDVEHYLCNAYLAQIFYCRRLFPRELEGDPAGPPERELLKRVEFVFAHIWRLDSNTPPLISLVDDLADLLTIYTPLLLRACADADYGNMPLPKFLKMWRTNPSHKPLLLALECKLSQYAVQRLSDDVTRENYRDRPILDYCLRPFLSRDQPCSAVVARVLELGADPNEETGESTVWIQFLQQLHKLTAAQRGNWAGVAKLMLQYGAAQKYTDQYGKRTRVEGDIDSLFDEDTACDLKQVLALSKHKRGLSLISEPVQRSQPGPGRWRKRWSSFVLRQKHEV
ncbi:NACHT domain-containing protein isoform 3 [Cladophialophora immunda]|nr:NACHT domain-containing protein isoform 1 [Cladophialophora immunda]OQU98831.1 NACHT domain-containing protein isoform 2 [Cladophialophora immunda]OQU98832.1 NACHT domain-containing protein isoform 3 [Cladophialophora immunda]